MFQFPHLPPTQGRSLLITGEGLPHSEISGSVGKRLPGAYRSVSTSFFGPGCLGIHHMLFLACLKLPLSLTLATLLPSSAHSLCRYVSTSEESETNERRENICKLQVQARSAFNIFDRVTQLRN